MKIALRTKAFASDETQPNRALEAILEDRCKRIR
jgi:hypothetical protein